SSSSTTPTAACSRSPTTSSRPRSRPIPDCAPDGRLSPSATPPRTSGSRWHGSRPTRSSRTRTAFAGLSTRSPTGRSPRSPEPAQATAEGECVEPLTDGDVPRWWQRLGLPGLVDIHTHFLPERMLRRVWAHFDDVAPLIGRPWPVTYRWDQDRRLGHLRGGGGGPPSPPSSSPPPP